VDVLSTFKGRLKVFRAFLFPNTTIEPPYKTILCIASSSATVSALFVAAKIEQIMPNSQVGVNLQVRYDARV